MAAIAEFLSDSEKKEIAHAIAEAESHTSGEIRVYIERKCKGDEKKRAIKIFHQLKMHRTIFHTGVLVYIAHEDRAFAIIGDRGIHEKVPENFWDDVKELMKNHFVEGKFAEGISKAIKLCGEHLKKHFPSDGHNPDELSNEVVIGKN